MTPLCGSSFPQGSSWVTFPNDSRGKEDFILETLAGELVTHTSDELMKVKKTKTRCFLHHNIGIYIFFCHLHCRLLIFFYWGKNRFWKSFYPCIFDELCSNSYYLAQRSTKTAAQELTVSASLWHTVFENSISEGFGYEIEFARELLQQPLGKSTKWSSFLACT